MAGKVLPHGYYDGQEVASPSELDCPEKCDIPGGLRLCQVVAIGTSFSLACPNDCGLALRFVVESK